ncbi:peptidoglycan DD-metalloendopeptidase family protein [Candidatus Peregrinibacteria bacterium]|jgi:murein DD-endopeptidase MepM/ murein hydrolase activator NlpD|nr:peptidoglycan DD-metalloendopeptidase family protein [Candidatus Peregrinibacteria bacterium]
MHKKTINVSAREERHSQIDFKSGAYYKNRKENTRMFLRLYSRIVLCSFCFMLLYFFSKHFAHAHNQELDTLDQEVDLEMSAREVYVLGDNGFVLKPSFQTEKGDRLNSREVISYKVEPGDTIYGIAAKFDIRAQTIIQNNAGLREWSVLKVGKEIKILPVDGLLYSTGKKDTLASIAKKFKVKEEDIERQNSLELGLISFGEEIIIPGAKKAVPVSRGIGAPIKAPSIYTGAISEGFIWPTNGKVTQYYRRGHYAIDVANRGKGPILASAHGTVLSSQSGWNGGYGNMIIVDHGNGFKTLYAHNEKLYVKVGDNVTQGQTIAWMGRTGRVRGVTGIHLHFEIIHNGVKKNPLAYIGNR